MLSLVGPVALAAPGIYRQFINRGLLKLGVGNRPILLAGDHFRKILFNQAVQRPALFIKRAQKSEAAKDNHRFILDTELQSHIRWQQLTRLAGGETRLFMSLGIGSNRPAAAEWK